MSREQMRQDLVAIIDRQLTNLRDLRKRHVDTLANSESAIKRIDNEIAELKRERETAVKAAML